MYEHHNLYRYANEDELKRRFTDETITFTANTCPDQMTMPMDKMIFFETYEIHLVMQHYIHHGHLWTGL